MEWQPIETAPKDGTPILAWNGFSQQVIEYSESSVFGRRKWVFGECEGSYNARQEFDDPTHWMPLPEPPNAPLHRPAGGWSGASGC